MVKSQRCLKVNTEGGRRVSVRVREGDVRIEAVKLRGGSLGETQPSLILLAEDGDEAMGQGVRAAFRS